MIHRVVQLLTILLNLYLLNNNFVSYNTLEHFTFLFYESVVTLSARVDFSIHVFLNICKLLYSVYLELYTLLKTYKLNNYYLF